MVRLVTFPFSSPNVGLSVRLVHSSRPHSTSLPGNREEGEREEKWTQLVGSRRSSPILFSFSLNYSLVVHGYLKIKISCAAVNASSEKHTYIFRLCLLTMQLCKSAHYDVTKGTKGQPPPGISFALLAQEGATSDFCLLEKSLVLKWIMHKSKQYIY